MSNNHRATMAKRQRELAQKDRVKEREARRLERKARAEARAASGQVGPPIADPVELEPFESDDPELAAPPDDTETGEPPPG
jgi:hypothetical protein